MATYSGTIRRGLPRVPGGEAWPAAGILAGLTEVAAAPVAEAPAVSAQTVAEPVVAAASSPNARHVRRGLPRIPGGERWPAVSPIGAALPLLEQPDPIAAEQSVTPAVMLTTAPAQAASGTPVGEADWGTIVLRRGLPRTPGGDAWPAAGFAPVAATEAVDAPATTAVIDEVPEPSPVIAPTPTPTPTPQTETNAKPAIAQAAQHVSKPVPRAKRELIIGGTRTRAQWIKLGVLSALGAIVAAGLIVLAARGVTTLPGVPEFLRRYPGEYHLPEVADPGFPAWARWTHFLNFFLMILIIRSGWQVRTQQKPPAFWTPKRGGKKISINLWVHTSIDVLWLLNGMVFVVLLFASGHWARIVPTSWEVFPNALSAMLQYLTLNWPVENGWVNYNSLQQIMYFLVVFVAAPLAAISGVRMSEWWPQNETRLNKLYPAPVARAIHFPTMLFFVLFIVIHVFLVFSTGALRNLNHMFAGTDVVNWTGFWLFAIGLLVTVGLVFAARPLVIAPIASLSGKVSNR